MVVKRKKKEEQNKTLYEKPIADQLNVSLEDLQTNMPIYPTWGIKKIAKVKTSFSTVIKLI